MIRFKTIEPAEAPAPTKKPAKTAPVAVATAEAGPATTEAPAVAGKGLKRKTPLRAKKPDAGRPFRD